MRFPRATHRNIYVRSERAGKRVMDSIGRFIEKKLKLKINREKSAVGRPQERKFLGFSFTYGMWPKRRIAPAAIERFKKRVKELTRRSRSISLEGRIRELNKYLVGWRGYFGYCETPSVLERLDSWIRRRLRAGIWKQWKRSRTRYRELVKLGVDSLLAGHTAGSAHDVWRVSHSPALNMAMPKVFFKSQGLASLTRG